MNRITNLTLIDSRMSNVDGWHRVDGDLTIRNASYGIIYEVEGVHQPITAFGTAEGRAPRSWTKIDINLGDHESPSYLCFSRSPSGYPSLYPGDPEERPWLYITELAMTTWTGPMRSGSLPELPSQGFFYVDLFRLDPKPNRKRSPWVWFDADTDTSCAIIARGQKK